MSLPSLALDWQDFARAAALMLVFEGLLPALAPSRARGLYSGIAKLEAPAVRRLGLASMIAGALALQAVRWLG